MIVSLIITVVELRLDTVLRQNAALLAQNEEARAQTSALMSKLDSILAQRLSSTNDIAPVTPAAPSLAPVFTRSSAANANKQQSPRGLANSPSSSSFPTTPALSQQQQQQQLPPELFDASMKEVTCDAVFKKWYTEGLCTCELPPAHELRPRMGRLARLVTYMKALLPPGTVIHPPPAVSASSYTAWRQTITSLCTAACAKLTELRLKQKQRTASASAGEDAVAGAKRKKPPALGLKFTAVDKELPLMPAEWFNMGACKDYCTTSSDYIYTTVADMRR